MPTIAVRLSNAERIELDDRAQGDISKYVRNALFGEGPRADDVLGKLALLSEDLSVLNAKIERLEAREPGQVVPSEADAQLKGMLLEVLLMLRGRLSPTERNAVHGTIESEGLPVWESSTPASSFMASNTTSRKAQSEVEKQDLSDSESQDRGRIFKKWR